MPSQDGAINLLIWPIRPPIVACAKIYICGVFRWYASRRGLGLMRVEEAGVKVDVFIRLFF